MIDEKDPKAEELKRKMLEEAATFYKTHVPIYKGCPRGPGDCNCTGDCQVVLSWREKTPDDEPIWTNSVKDDNYWKSFNRHNMPQKGGLILLQEPRHFSPGEILVGIKSFIQTSCVPFVKYNNEYYRADTIEVLPSDLIGKLASCRKYIKSNLPEEMKNLNNYVYNFD